MPLDTPPFDPPYVSMHDAAEGAHYIETLADGATRPVAATAFGLAWHSAARSDALAEPPARTKTSSSKPKPSSSSSDRAYLSVPYAEKDEAKALGARWDATKKKWYAPQGADMSRFERWLPTA